jgi:hypothetical protein
MGVGSEFFRGVALVLADFANAGQHDSIRAFIANYDLSWDDFATAADEEDLVVLRDILLSDP